MKKTMGILAIILLILYITTSCTQPEVEELPDEVIVQLKFLHQAQFSGFYLAREKGYYEQENIKVTFLEGGEGINILDRLTSGQANFLVASPERILTSGIPDKPIAIATIYRYSPVVFIALAESGISKPADFIGKKVGITGVNQDVIVKFVAMMKKLDIDNSEIILVPYDYNYNTLLNQDIDITYGYITGGIIRLRQQGHQLNLIWPSDYGIHMYSDTLFTTEQLIADNPDLVYRFLRATLKGWREAMGDSAVALEATMEYAKETDSELQAAMLAAQLPLVHTGEDQIGWMRPEIWQEMYQMLLEQGLIPAPFDPDKIYTMQFLEQVYGD